MGDRMVKKKLGIFNNSGVRVGKHGYRLWIVFALLSFIASWAGVFPAGLVEWYARKLFPGISFVFGRVADALPFSWLDLLAASGIALIAVSVWKKRFRLLCSIAAASYLLFFWSWGINYHRMPLESRLPFDTNRTTAEHIHRLARRAASEMNRLYTVNAGVSGDEDGVRQYRAGISFVREEAAQRVARVVAVIDGRSWQAASRIKTSVLANPWFRIAGIDGVFNPLVHEPVINRSLLDIERPFVVAHEFAHVRGYPSEGDANLIAVLATIMSGDSTFEYSGWLHLWFYVRSRELDSLLEPGPRADIQRIVNRARAEQIRWVSQLQTVILDWFLKSNSVEEGVRSYAHLVVLAAGTEDHWERFR